MAVAFNSFDTLLAPFVKKDALNYKQTKQEMQNYIFSINSNSRSGAEPAFTNVTFDLTPSKSMINENPIIAEEVMPFTYKDCQPEMDMINRAFCEIMLGGDGLGRPFAYPIPTYNIHERFDWDNPNNDLIFEMSGKFGYPYFANFLNSDMDIDDARSMCPMHESTNVLIKDSEGLLKRVNVKSLYSESPKGTEFTVLQNNEEKKAKLNEFKNLNFKKITLVNGRSLILSTEHLNKTLDGDKETKYLSIDDFIPFNRIPLQGTNQKLTWKKGLLIGALFALGSFNEERNYFSFLIPDSVANEKKSLFDSLKAAALEENFTITNRGDSQNTKFVSSNKFNSDYSKKFIHFGEKENIILDSVLSESMSFREGIISGFFLSDDLKSLSEEGRESLFMVLNSAGDITLNPFDLEDIDNYRGSDNGKTTWIKIKSIEDSFKNETGYCFEVQGEDEEPYFQLPDGWITHNCRLRLNLKELRRRNGGLFGSGDATGSVAVVTINLPRIGYNFKGDKEGFFKQLDVLLDISKDSLEIRRSWVQKNILDKHLIPAFETYVGTLSNHFSTIGVIGMNEMCENFMEKNILDPEAKEFALEVGEHIRQKLVEFQEETGHLYNYEATPAESTCYRLARLDKERYPDIITQGTDLTNCYYTNSCHIPVSLVESIDQVFKHQDELQVQFTGGTVIHLYEEGSITSEQAKSIVRSCCENFRAPYMSISPLTRFCPEHGFVREKVENCPICNTKLDMYQRVTGYIRKVDNFNNGKAQEFKDRKQLKS